MQKPLSVSTNEEAHAVQFYTDDDFLLKGLCEFVRIALNEGQSVILVMTVAHKKGLMEYLHAANIRVRTAAKQGRFVTLDAGETLTTFMHGDTPVPMKFLSQIGSVIRRASTAASDRNKPVAIFGEMVAVLWSQRRFTAAIELEQLWNELAKAHRFYLRCAYPANGFGDDMKVPYAMVCAQHSHIFSADSATESLSQQHLGDETPNYSRAA